MNDINQGNFGLMIAYLLPGFAVVWGLRGFSPTLQSWIGLSAADSPTIGGFLFVTLASVAAGLIVSTVHWLLIDTLHHATGLHEPHWDFSDLQANLTALSMPGAAGGLSASANGGVALLSRLRIGSDGDSTAASAFAPLPEGRELQL